MDDNVQSYPSFSLKQLDQKKKKKKTSDPSSRRSVSANQYIHQNREVEVTTTIKTRGGSGGMVQVRPTSAREVSLHIRLICTYVIYAWFVLIQERTNSPSFCFCSFPLRMCPSVYLISLIMYHHF